MNAIDHAPLHEGAAPRGRAFLRVLRAARSRCCPDVVGVGAAGRAGLAWVVALAGLVALAGACDGGPGGDDGGPGPDFDDHTFAALESVAAFDEAAVAGPSSTALKFIITRFQQAEQSAVFLDPAHYTLHDEWYWFRLLNGAAVDGVDTAPVPDLPAPGEDFETIAEIRAWAETQATLPLDLTFVQDGRLYSPRFYELALATQPKALGVGTVLHFRARPDADPPLPEQWGMELEFQHVLSAAELAQFFAALDRALPGAIRGQLKLLVRSQQQEQLAQQLEAEGSPLAERILRYSDVTVPGETEVYSEGLVAGRLRFVRAGESFDDAGPNDILVAEEMPDYLPQCAALITAVPQTALAHVNILAKNRGIPNAYRGAVLDDPELDSLARVRAPVIVKATLPGDLQIVAMTEAEFAQFRALGVVPPTAVPPIDLTDVEHTYDLEALDFADEDQWRPVLGGKSFGFIGLLDAGTDGGGLTLPPRPLGLSIKGFVEHTAALRPRLEAMLLDPAFTGDIDVRVLVLEGAAGWAERHPEDPGFPQRFLQTRAPGDTLRALVEGGGVKAAIEDAPMSAVLLAEYTAALEDHFGHYAPEQKLRFRSSSNVEDAEGFIGAGLYESFSGALRFAETGERSPEEAIKKVWATYWGSEAFEERKLANVAHLSGSMGITVHASFQDELERGNAVVTYSILPPGHPDGAHVMEVNAQEGALSVTNPPPGDPNLPEVTRLVLDEEGAIEVQRVRGSTLLPAGQHVFSDAQLLDTFAQIRGVAELWLAHENDKLPASQERSTLTLDLEIREVARGWPALDNGNAYGARVVVKQARLLEPLTRAPATVQSLPIPKDVLGRALRIEQRRCESASVALTITDVFTDARKKPDLGFTRAPFTSFIVLDFSEDVPEVGATAGQRRSAVHTAFTATHPGMDAGGAYALDLVVDEGAVASVGVAGVTLEANGALTLTREGTATSQATCTSDILFSSPEAFLESILAARSPAR